MGSESETASGWLATLTHARLRAEQGDVGGARKILRELLDRDPGDEEARDFLQRLPSAGSAPKPEPGGERLEPVVAAEPAGLAGAFRGVLAGSRARDRRRAIQRLEAWLHRVQKVNGDEHV